MPVSLIDSRGALPATSFKSYLIMLNYLHEHGIPNRLEIRLWNALYAESMANKVRSGFRWLGWIVGRDNIATPELARVADPSSRKESLRGTLEIMYGQVIPVAQRDDTSRQELYAAFGRVFHAQGYTQTKGVTFFLDAATYSGIPLAPQLARASQVPSDETDKPDKEKADTVVQPTVAPDDVVAQEDPEMIQLRSKHEDRDPGTEFLSIMEVLSHRIPASRRWAQQEHDAFVRAVDSILMTLMKVEKTLGPEREQIVMNGLQHPYERTPAGNGDMRS